MEKTNWLELNAEIKNSISLLEKMLTPNVKITDLDSPFPSTEQLSHHLHNQRIRSYLSNCREQEKYLGIRKGEKVKSSWLERLSLEEQEVFVKYYEQKKTFSQISTEVGLKEDEVKEYFNRSLKKVIKKLKGE
ncbi:MAG TPA: sigma factor-like helix-turn-helix DNA-binding protein [Bacillus sp. (in: firmicutes)]|nr:sigma factor-like helix-turn-helix DNA-binding protein [Bacillus sp. (in: firmicutes)]